MDIVIIVLVSICIVLLVINIFVSRTKNNADIKLDGFVNLINSKNEALFDKVNMKNDEINKALKDVSESINNTNKLIVDNLISINKSNSENYINLSKKMDGLSKQRVTLMNTYNKIMEEQIMKNTFIIDGVSKINQYSQGYPTGCESAALTILLKYYGVNVSMSDVVNKLPKGKLPYYENGVKYGGNPYIEFIGHPSDYNSYGVYEKPILQVAESFKSGVIDGSGMSLDEVLKIVREGRPVMVWVSMGMAVPYVSTSWIYKPTGEKISWLSNEHAVVVIGYNQNSIIVTDSLTGSIRYFDRNIFKSRYNTYGKRAVYY